VTTVLIVLIVLIVCLLNFKFPLRFLGDLVDVCIYKKLKSVIKKDYGNGEESSLFQVTS